MKSRWVSKGITACMNLGRQASLKAADTLSGPIAFLPLQCVVEPNSRAVNLGVLIVCIRSEGLKDLLPDTTVAPAHVASMYDLKVPKAFGQIAPGDDGPITIEHRLDKQTIVLGNHPNRASSAGEQVINTLPPIITESITLGGHRVPLKCENEK